MISVTVIIPVFNAARHLGRCIESLLAQTLVDCEFLFVNDGSTDESQSIVEQFQKKDSRIVLINQQNQGVSAARNAGLAKARGNYIGFADADDTAEPNMFENLLGLARQNEADIIVSRYVQHQQGKEFISAAVFPENEVLDSSYVKQNIIPYCIANENLNAVWNKLYRRGLLQDNALVFPVGVALGEDGWFNMQAFNNAKSVYFTDFSGYHYYETDGSATRDFASKDYYRPLVEEYQRDYRAYENQRLTAAKIEQLKAEKFLNKTVSLIHEYANPVHKIGYKMARRKISAMLNDATFKAVLHQNYNQITAKKGKYEQFILWAARHKWVSLLFTAAAYSRLRNK